MIDVEYQDLTEHERYVLFRLVELFGDRKPPGTVVSFSEILLAQGFVVRNVEFMDVDEQPDVEGFTQPVLDSLKQNGYLTTREVGVYGNSCDIDFVLNQKAFMAYGLAHNQPDVLEKLYHQHKSNLSTLELQRAQYARGEEPLHLLNAIRYEQEAIAELEQRFRQRSQNSAPQH